MILNNRAFLVDPAKCTPIEPDLDVSSQETIDGVDVFSWGEKIIGKDIEMSWEYLEETEYQYYRGVYRANAPVPFDPAPAGVGDTYTVRIKSFTGDYFLGMQYRENAKMVLIIEGIL